MIIKAALVATVTSVALLGFTPVAAADPPASGPPGQKPPPSYAEAAASADWVPTPPGLAYKSCVHEVPDGAFVSADGVVSVGGVVIETLPMCPYSGVVPVPRSPQAEAALAQAAANGQKNHGTSAGKDDAVPRSEQAGQALADALANGAKDHGASSTADDQVPEPYSTGWWLASWSNQTSEIMSLSANWAVPPGPSLITGQTIVLFPSVQLSSAGNSIVQPVLQFGPSRAGGGNYWALANWFVTVGRSIFTTPVSTAAGHLITGSMSRATAGNRNWSITIKDVTTGAGSTLTVDTGLTSWRSAQGGVLEVYGIMSCARLPGGGSATFVTFSGISLKTAAGTVSSPSWTKGPATSACFGSLTTTNASTTLKWNAP